MPQLDLAPWLMVLFFFWIILVFMAPKVLAQSSTNTPSQPLAQGYKTSPWHWTWA